jgi:solute carrier family 9 (sodium/hydrogen exchanger), member 6/7
LVARPPPPPTHTADPALFSAHAGALVGGIIRLSGSLELKALTQFNSELFFFLLLPPIIFNSGYDLRRVRSPAPPAHVCLPVPWGATLARRSVLMGGWRLQGNFFKNFGVILSFAFLGTTISTFVTGCVPVRPTHPAVPPVVGMLTLLSVFRSFLLYALILAGVNAAELGLIDCLIFGALISATDPGPGLPLPPTPRWPLARVRGTHADVALCTYVVTVLAIFHAMHVDPKLFAIVFGESILNDAVAIVLFESLQVFRHSPVTFLNVGLALGSFVGIFFGSFAIGTLLGCFSALVRSPTCSLKGPPRHRCHSPRLATMDNTDVQAHLPVPVPQL